MLAAAAIAPPPQAELMASLMVEVAEAEDELAEAEGTEQPEKSDGPESK
jgi:hypothetical protein